jgi:hypothetical protein
MISLKKVVPFLVLIIGLEQMLKTASDLAYMQSRYRYVLLLHIDGLHDIRTSPACPVVTLWQYLIPFD